MKRRLSGPWMVIGYVSESSSFCLFLLKAGKKSGIRTQESGVAGVAEYASKVFIRKSRTSISLGKSSPSSQIL